MHIVVMVVVGLIAGALARLLVPGKDPMGLFMTALLGIAGSFVGGFIARMIWPPAHGESFQPAGLLMSVLGAIVLLLLWRMIRPRAA